VDFGPRAWGQNKAGKKNFAGFWFFTVIRPINNYLFQPYRTQL
jgi:hypothetical protein